MIFVRSLIFNLYFVLLTTVVAILFAPLILIRPIAFIPPKIWAICIVFGLKYICNIRYEIIGKENIIPDKGCVYISKHQSAWETVMFYLVVKQPAYVLKKELTRIPIVNLFFWGLKMIVVDRKAGSRALKQLLLDAKDRLESGRQVIIFPEGTRIKHGEIGRINPGVYSIYKEVETSYIPVALNSGKCWGRNAFFKKPGVITIKFLPALPKGLGKDEFNKRVEQDINSL